MKQLKAKRFDLKGIKYQVFFFSSNYLILVNLGERKEKIKELIEQKTKIKKIKEKEFGDKDYENFLEKNQNVMNTASTNIRKNVLSDTYILTIDESIEINDERIKNLKAELLHLTGMKIIKREFFLPI